jgi:hypothetical protein
VPESYWSDLASYQPAIRSVFNKNPCTRWSVGAERKKKLMRNSSSVPSFCIKRHDRGERIGAGEYYHRIPGSSVVSGTAESQALARGENRRRWRCRWKYPGAIFSATVFSVILTRRHYVGDAEGDRGSRRPRVEGNTRGGLT